MLRQYLMKPDFHEFPDSVKPMGEYPLLSNKLSTCFPFAHQPQFPDSAKSMRTSNSFSKINYSKTSLNEPIMASTLNGSFREVVVLGNWNIGTNGIG